MAPAGETRETRETQETRYVVGIDVAKQTRVVCAPEAPSGIVRHKPGQIEATRQGYALLVSWLATWRAGAEPEAVLIGLEATGVLWEPLYDALTQAGYTVLVRESAPNGLLGDEPGAARQNGQRRCAHAGAWTAGRTGAREYAAH